MGSSNPIEGAQIGAEIAGLSPIPGDQLVLLRILVLLRVGNGAAFSQLVTTVDSIGGKERAGEDQPDLERRDSALLQKLGKDVGRARPEVAAHVLRFWIAGELGGVLLA